MYFMNIKLTVNNEVESIINRCAKTSKELGSNLSFILKPYRMEWQNNSTYNFSFLQDVQKFIDNCDADITDDLDYIHSVDNSMVGYYLSYNLVIDTKEENVLIFTLSLKKGCILYVKVKKWEKVISAMLIK